MTSYFSSLLTTTTSRVASIRQNLLPTENDGDTEDDTHVCRVLRAYYTEKGRAFPTWLPPDPKAPPPPVVQPVYAQSNVGSRYGGLQNQAGGSGSGSGSGAFGSLWDKQPAQPVPQSGSQSLRQGRAPGGMAASRGSPFAREQQQQPVAAAQETRVQGLPSERAGSYQQVSREEARKQKLLGGGGLRAPAQAQRAQSYESAAANSPWSGAAAGAGAGSYDDGGYGGGRSMGGGYGAPAPAPAAAPAAGRPGLPSGPGAGRRGMGLPSGPRGYK
ncbi:hypothetical protein LZ554_006632 [Drepanopeziza brunnea f. sp. 'monogermtubi']|nr:hypothetical protein LZ554_006632 [Drepanopeziza brunnea f. sp. 'monogermtubi']